MKATESTTVQTQVRVVEMMTRPRRHDLAHIARRDLLIKIKACAQTRINKQKKVKA